MNYKKSILSVFAVFLVSNVLTTVWYMLTDDANFVPYRRAEINYLGLTLNHLVYASVFVLLFPSFYAKAPKLSRGFQYGVLLGVVMFLPSAMVIRSIWQVEFNGIFLLNSVAHLLIGGLMGIVISLIYNYKKTQA